MNASGHATRVAGWGALSRWVFLSLLVHVGVVCLLGTWSPTSAPGPPATSKARLVWLPGGTPRMDVLPASTVLAEVSDGGFSGPLWRGRSEVGWSSLLRAEVGGGAGNVAIRGPRFSVSGLGGAAGQPSPGGWWRSGAQRPVPALGPGRPGTSLLRLGGSLASLPLRQSPVIPCWTNTDVLASTTVQLLVEADGAVLSASVLPPGSGSATADAEALRQARGLQFQPRPARGLDQAEPGWLWGTAEFVWGTVDSSPP